MSMDKTAILRCFRTSRNVLERMAWVEKHHADQLDDINTRAGDWSRGVTDGLRIAVHLIERNLSMFGEEGQDA